MTTEDFTALAIVLFLGLIAPWAFLNIYADARRHRSLRERRLYPHQSFNPPPPMPKTGFSTSDPTWLDMLHDALQAQIERHETELKANWGKLDKEDREAHTWHLGEQKKLLRAIKAGSRCG